MNGQWMGPYSGTNTGLLVLDLDKTSVAGRYAGVAFAYDGTPTLPVAIAFVELPIKKRSMLAQKLSLRFQLLAIDRLTGNVLDADALTKHYPNVQIPTYADTEWNIESTKITVSWTI